MSLNKMLVIGNVGTDPELRYTPNDKAVAAFRLATTHKYTTGDGEKREETEWLTVTAWGKLAEQVNTYVNKGGKVYVELRLKSGEWTGQDGQMRFNNEIVASRVLFLNRSPDEVVADAAQTTPGGTGATRPW